jgi:hypothetical protein
VRVGEKRGFVKKKERRREEKEECFSSLSHFDRKEREALKQLSFLLPGLSPLAVFSRARSSSVSLF